MYPKLVQNFNQLPFALQNVLVILGELWKKVSKFSGNKCCLEFKGPIVLIKGNIFQLSKVTK